MTQGRLWQLDFVYVELLETLANLKQMGRQDFGRSQYYYVLCSVSGCVQMCMKQAVQCGVPCEYNGLIFDS